MENRILEFIKNNPRCYFSQINKAVKGNKDKKREIIVNLERKNKIIIQASSNGWQHLIKNNSIKLGEKTEDEEQGWKCPNCGSIDDRSGDPINEDYAEYEDECSECGTKVKVHFTRYISEYWDAEIIE